MPKIDPQDPLPEPTWLWRRVYVYGVSIVFLALVSVAVDRLSKIAIDVPGQGVDALLSVIQWLLAALICVITYYLVAPSAEQIVKMIQAARLRRAEGPKPPTPPAPSEGTEEPPKEAKWD